jgi:ribosomal protein S18 acetylase RimI-like enzyme
MHSDPRYRVVRPTEDLGEQAHKQGQVHAELSAGNLVYGLGPGERTISLVRIEVHEALRRRGIATELVQRLRNSFLGYRIVDGGSTNSPDGDALLAKLRAMGLVEPADNA